MAKAAPKSKAKAAGPRPDKAAAAIPAAQTQRAAQAGRRFQYDAVDGRGKRRTHGVPLILLPLGHIPGYGLAQLPRRAGGNH